MNRLRSILVFFSLFLWMVNSVLAQPETPKDASEIQLALQKLNVLGSALYLAAHPDDENTAVLAYLSKGRLVRTGYLSMTRGDGGQNLVGTEQGEYLGLLRTWELLDARKIDGAKQFFTRAIDFGYSKTPEETLDIWGHEKVLSDVVWVIRKFRPDVIITRFTPTRGGHGHHLASAILALEAFRKAGDPTAFPEQLKYVQPWQPKRILWNVFQWGGLPDTMDTSKLVTADVGDYNALLGKSYTEIAARARSMHKSQGFGVAARRGEHTEYFKLLAGDPAANDLFDGINLGWSRVSGSGTVAGLLKKANAEFQPQNPAGSMPLLLEAYQKMNDLKPNYWVDVKQKEVADIIRSCTGLWLETVANEYSVTPGANLPITVTAINRSDFPLQLKSVALAFQTSDSVVNQPLRNNVPLAIKTHSRVPPDVEYSQPYWLREKPLKGTYRVSDQELIGLPDNPPQLFARITLGSGDATVDFTVPVLYRWTDPVEGERYRSVDVVPPVTANFDEGVYIFPDAQSKKASLKLKSGSKQISGAVKLTAPAGWKIEPGSIAFSFDRKNQEQPLQFTITPSENQATGSLTAEVETANGTYSYSIVTVDHPYIPIQTVFPPAQASVVRLNLNEDGKYIGYIMGPGDDIPQCLQQAGYDVKLLSESDVAGGPLSNFDAIVTGIRAYNTNPWLKYYNRRLLDYVHDGGTLVVQYDVSGGLVMDSLGPFPYSISHDRVTVEEAPVTFLQPEHPLLNYPNRITAKDFEGWVQERGLYFPDRWDSRYQTIISCHDPGETPKAGGLLYAQYGKGIYIYTGYSFFRQLPAGVPGAYRLFVNLISARQKNEKRNLGAKKQ